MPVIELRQRSRGFVELQQQGQGQQAAAYYDDPDDKGGSSSGFGPGAPGGAGRYPGGAGGAPPWPPHGRPGPGRLAGGGGDDDGSDDDFSASGPHAADPWRRFRKTSRERLLRGFSPLRRTVAEAAHHPAAPKVYRFLFFFSLVAVLYLSSIAHLLMQDSPLFRMHSPAGLTRREMGWAVVEAAAMYAVVMAISGYAWYRHSKRRAQVGGSVRYTRLRGPGGQDHPSLYNPRFDDPFY